MSTKLSPQVKCLQAVIKLIKKHGWERHEVGSKKLTLSGSLCKANVYTVASRKRDLVRIKTTTTAYNIRQKSVKPVIALLQRAIKYWQRVEVRNAKAAKISAGGTIGNKEVSKVCS